MVVAIFRGTLLGPINMNRKQKAVTMENRWEVTTGKVDLGYLQKGTSIHFKYIQHKQRRKQTISWKKTFHRYYISNMVMTLVCMHIYIIHSLLANAQLNFQIYCNHVHLYLTQLKSFSELFSISFEYYYKMKFKNYLSQKRFPF